MIRTLQLMLVIVLFTATISVAQQQMKPPVIVCPADYTNSDLRVPPPAKFLENLTNARKTANSNAQTAQIIVTYRGFENFQEAKDAFQFAVDIWSTLIKSEMPIYLDANYEELASGVLGSAGPSGLYKGFEGAPNDSMWYSTALAEKMAGYDLNKPGDADISASFSSVFDWYLGTDGNTTAGKYDFVSVVLHEIGHGLGFLALNGYDDANSTGSRNPGAYDSFIEDGNGLNMFDVANNSAELGQYFTSNNLFLNAPLAAISNTNSPPKIYAPSSYNSGSSISHWDENTFNGTENALLTPQFAPGESIHNPGPLTMSLFANLGWVHTRLKHQPDLIIDNLVDNILISVEVVSDTTLSSDQPMLHYSFDGFNSQTDQAMNDDGNGMYSFSIPNPAVASTLEYYISGVSDDLGRDYTSPSSSSKRHKSIIQNMPSTSVPYSLADGGDFENSSEFTQISLKGNMDIWEQGVPGNNLNTPSSGTQVWKTDLDANILKPTDDYTTALISPKFDLSDTTADYTLKFDLSMDVDIDSAVAGLSVAYSVDGGLNWFDLGQPDDGRGKNWMNKSEEFRLFESGNGWVLNNSVDAPQTVSYNLSEIIADGEAEVYFALKASVTNAYNDEIYVFDGIMIDDFEVTKTEPRAFFSVSGSSVNFPGKNLQFNYISKGAETFSWDFGDGEFSNAKNPVHAYQSGGVYDVSLTITYPGGGTHSNTEVELVYVVEKKGSTYTLVEGGDMESNFNDFQADNVRGTPFERGMSTIAGKNGVSSGVNAWVTGLTAAQYEDNSEAFLYTPLFDFSLLGTYNVSFMANYSLEEGWDAFILESSIDNGANWEQVNPVVTDGWYDIIGEDNVVQGWPAIPMFSGSTNGAFVTKSVDLSNLAGNESVIFRFHFKSDAAELDVGLAIDDFVLTGPQTGPAIADFTFTEGSGCDEQVITFTNTSTGSISASNWDFGANATPATATGFGPFDVTYVGAGKSTVTLTVEGVENGTLVETKTDIISTAPQHTPTFTEEAVADNDAQRTLVSSAGDSYQWYMNNELIEGAINQTYLATETASYAVEVEVDGCIGVSDNTKLITALIDDYFGNSIFIYPNPTTNKITLDVTNESKGDVLIKIYNVSGKLYFEENSIKNHAGFTKQIDVSIYNRGIYFVELQFNDHKAVRKLIVE